MKYSQEIIIDAPVEKVVRLFEDPRCEKYCHPGLISHELLSGTKGQVGAKSKLKYENFDLYETVTVRNLPHEFSGTYDMSAMKNTLKNTFTPVEGNKTKLTVEIDYVFKQFIPKLMSWVVPGVYKKQSYKFLVLFKEFVEKN